MASSLMVVGCAWSPDWLASSGPNVAQVYAAADDPGTSGIQVVTLTDGVARRLAAHRTQPLFSETLVGKGQGTLVVGPGDGVEVAVWEAPPSILYGGGSARPGTGPATAAASTGTATAAASTVPEQMVSQDGTIGLPFVGRVPVAGKTTQQIESELERRLQGKANQPQVQVRVTKNTTANVTMIGEVTKSALVPLTARGERLLDALAASGGVKQPLEKVTLQVTRGNQVQAMSLQAIVQDPRQNVRLQSGDVIAALYQPLSFTALGATGTNQEVYFEAQGISLVQALGRAGGLQDNRARASGAFVFRFEDPSALDWAVPPRTTPDGKVAVVYRVDLRNPATFFAAQNFQMQNKDILYVSNATSSELQKFLNLIMSTVYPLVNFTSALSR